MSRTPGRLCSLLSTQLHSQTVGSLSVRSRAQLGAKLYTQLEQGLFIRLYRQFGEPFTAPLSEKLRFELRG